MKATSSPMVARHRLGAALRDARLAAGRTQQAVADVMDWSTSKVIRIESGSVGVATSDLTAMLFLLGISADAETAELVELARASRRPPWWREFADVAGPTQLRRLEYATAASAIHQVSFEAIPALLQEERYARVLLAAVADDRAARRVDLLMRHQQVVLGRTDAPELLFVLEEAALRRQVGGRTVMREQLQHLQELAAHDHITILVVPFATPAHPGTWESFTILEIPGGGDVVYVERGHGGATEHTDAEAIGAYRRRVEEFHQLAALTSLDAVLDKARVELSG